MPVTFMALNIFPLISEYRKTFKTVTINFKQGKKSELINIACINCEA